MGSMIPWKKHLFLWPFSNEPRCRAKMVRCWSFLRRRSSHLKNFSRSSMVSCCSFYSTIQKWEDMIRYAKIRICSMVSWCSFYSTIQIWEELWNSFTNFRAKERRRPGCNRNPLSIAKFAAGVEAKANPDQEGGKAKNSAEAKNPSKSGSQTQCAFQSTTKWWRNRSIIIIRWASNIVL